MSYKHLFNLDGKVALVVGAAGGLGEAACVALGEFGANLAVADLDADSLAPLAEKLMGQGLSVWSRSCDVSDDASVKRLMDAVVERFGRLDIMINFVGIGWRGPLAEVDSTSFMKTMEVNLLGSFLLAQHSLRLMLPNGSGKIILVGSVSGRIGRPYSAAYTASKGGVHAMVRSMAVEYARTGIQINSLAPVFTLTKMTSGVLSDPAVEKSLVSTIPMGRLGVPSDLAGAIIFLASQASDFVTGHTIYVDGGCTIS